MGIVHMPVIRDYHKKDPTLTMLQYLPISLKKSLDNFTSLTTPHSSHDERSSPSYDWLGKIRPIIESLSELSSQVTTNIVDGLLIGP